MKEPAAVKIRCADGRELPARLHAAPAPAAAALIAPALGVPRRWYDAFGAALAERGISTLTFDYRGIADAEGPDAQDRDIAFADWGRLDVAAALEFVRSRVPGRPLLYVGHSCGTQLMGLAPQSGHLAALVLVSPSAPHASHWTGPSRWFLRFLWRMFIPRVARGRVRFPARRLGISSVDAPASVMRDWARWCASPRYLFSPEHGYDLSRYPALRIPALVLEFTDDRFSPAATVDALLREMPNLSVTRRRIAPGEVGAKRIGHLGFFHRAHAGTLWRQTAEWMLAAAGGEGRRARTA